MKRRFVPPLFFKNSIMKSSMIIFVDLLFRLNVEASESIVDVASVIFFRSDKNPQVSVNTMT